MSGSFAVSVEIVSGPAIAQLERLVAAAQLDEELSLQVLAVFELDKPMWRAIPDTLLPRFEGTTRLRLVLCDELTRLIPRGGK